MITLLKPSQAHLLQQLRLLSLQTDPHAYFSTYKSEKNFDTAYFEHKIRYATTPPCYGYYGYFIHHRLTPTSLAGYVQLAPEPLTKARHLANIYELYVHPRHRQHSIASQLISHLLHQAQTSPDLEQLHLRVTSTNQPAISLYQRLGFSHIATRPKALKELNGDYQDELMFTFFLPHHPRVNNFRNIWESPAY